MRRRGETIAVYKPRMRAGRSRFAMIPKHICICIGVRIIYFEARNFLYPSFTNHFRYSLCSNSKENLTSVSDYETRNQYGRMYV